jgi:hypothetical protein
MILKNKNCGRCLNNRKTGIKKNYNFLTGILLAILPKCPFCVMAYSSTVFLCGKDTLIENHYNYSSPLSILITAFFCSLIIFGLLLNFRGIRTKYALALAGSGILMIMHSMISSGGQQLYYSGVALVFIAVWLNGSLLSILRKLKITFSNSVKAVAGNA